MSKDLTLNDLDKNIPLVARKSADQKTVIDLGYDVTIGGDSLTIFAGPCAVQREYPVSEIASAVSKAGAQGLRGGVFKPLTFPYPGNFKFTELGEEGYRMLQEAGKSVGLPVITEVGSVEDVPLVARYADVLQVGARNMQNFALLKAVGEVETETPVLLKRNFGASLRDWLGAAEHIMVAGNPNVILCERGIAAPHTHTPNSRFLPDIAAIPYAQKYTHLPVVFDPSHSTFNREMVAPMARAAIAAGADGLLIDVHPEPEKAAVDPLQALSYSAFEDLMNDLKKIAPIVGRTL